MGSKPLIVCKKKERKGHVYTINRIGVFFTYRNMGISINNSIHSSPSFMYIPHRKKKTHWVHIEYDMELRE
jgi:hypothetical protein